MATFRFPCSPASCRLCGQIHRQAMHAYGLEGNEVVKIPLEPLPSGTLNFSHRSSRPLRPLRSGKARHRQPTEDRRKPALLAGGYARAIQKYEISSDPQFIPGAEDAKAADDLATIWKLNPAQCLL